MFADEHYRVLNNVGMVRGYVVFQIARLTKLLLAMGADMWPEPRVNEAVFAEIVLAKKGFATCVTFMMARFECRTFADLFSIFHFKFDLFRNFCNTVC